MRVYILLFILGAFSIGVSAQEKTAGLRPVFRSAFAVAVMNGSASTSFNIQTVHGIYLNKSFAGLGAGIDYYKFRTLPVFLQLRQEFGKGKKHFLVYGDGGRSIDWLTEKSKQVWRWQSAVDFKGGWYYDIGVGYRINFKESAMILTTGYNYKELRRDETYSNCIFGGECINETETFMYKMSRISVRAAFQF